nr:helicase [Tanacetum cinerariifolium]
ARGVIVQDPSEFKTTSSLQPSQLPHANDKEGYKQKDFRGKSFDAIKEMFDKVYKKGNTFVAMDSKVMEGSKKTQAKVTEGSSKRVGAEIEKESAKRQRLEKEDDTAELKRCLEIVPEDDDDVTIEATPLSSKSPTIVNYKNYKERKKSYFKIIRKNKSLARAVEKQGLPHAHILLWLEDNSKCKSAARIDDIISAELPSPTDDPDGYKVVTEYMLHGPCKNKGRYAPCITEGKFTKRYPKAFYAEAVVDDDGYPVYRRWDNKVCVKKGKFTFNNRHVVSHNRYLLMKYHTHINVEWCSRSKAIKYLFKYLSKGPDRATIFI